MRLSFNGFVTILCRGRPGRWLGARGRRCDARPQGYGAPRSRASEQQACASGPVAGKRRSVVRAAVPARPSFGQLAGLHSAQDDLDLKSSVALVIDQDTREVLFSKNDSAVLPIASLTKLMTGLIVSEAKLPMDEPITITQDDVDTEKGSRLAPEGRRHAHPRRTDAPVADVQRKPRRERAGPHLPGRHGGFVSR